MSRPRRAASRTGAAAALASSTPFWRFSLRLYARPGVAPACLWLQERCGADVNLLLLCCWLAGRGRAVGRRFLAGTVAGAAAWRREAVDPLRRVRRRLARGVRGVAPAWREAARERVKAAELAAERVEQALLVRRAARLARGTAIPGDAWASLARYADLLGAGSVPGSGRRLAVLRAATTAAARAG